MSRTFVQASSEYGEYAGAVATAAPLTLACWFYSASITLSQYLICIGNSSNTSKFALIAAGATAGDPIQALSNSTAAASATGYSANTWTHAAAVFESSTSRYACINGTRGTQNVTSVTPAGLDRTAVGRRNDTSPANYMSGRIAEAGVWSAALTETETLMLAAGFSPLTVRPASLVAYWPLWGDASPERDLKGRFELTLTGSALAEHCRTIGPTRLTVGKASAAAVTSRPFYFNQFIQSRRGS